MTMSEHEKKWITDHGAEMIRSLGINEGHSVIEFGCGIGRYAIPLSQVVGENGQVLAVEREAEEVAVLRERINLFCEKGSVEILNSEDIQLQSVDNKTMDHVLAFDVLQYIEDFDLFFKSVHRVLKPGGSLHIYPAKIPHPGAVNMKHVTSIIHQLGLRSKGNQPFRMMHNKDMVDDVVYTFKLSA